MKPYISTFFLLILIFFNTHAQTLLKGRVTDKLQKPIADVSITSKGKTSIKVLSNANGEFTIPIHSDNQELRFSHVGYISKTIRTNNPDQFFTVILDTVHQNIDEVEVVSTGYQNIPKERSTGSFEQAGKSILDMRVSSNILDKLDGQVPGLQYDNRFGSPKLNIRGINTMSDALMGPLIVVDNFPYEGNLNDLNPNDVESVTVLKDAAATSIWGARAGNGVIVINLKKPQTNTVNLDFTANLLQVGDPRFKESQRMSSSDFIDVERMLFEKGFYNSSYNNPNNKNTIFSPVVDMLFDNQKGYLSKEEMENKINDLRQIDFQDQVLRYLYRKETLQQYALSLNNGYKNGAYRLSLSYNDSYGAKIGDRNHVLSASLQNQMKITNNLDIGTRLTFQKFNSTLDNNPMGYSFGTGGGKGFAYPYMALKDENGNNLSVPYQYNSKYMERINKDPLLDWTYVPLDETGYNVSTSTHQQIEAQFDINYRFTSWLNAKAIYNYQGQQGGSELLHNEESFYTRDLINKFSQITNGVPKYIVPLGAINKLSNSFMNSHKVRGTLNVDKSFLNNQHQFSGIVGAELSNVINHRTSHTAYGYDIHLMTSQAVDYLNLYPIYDGLSGSTRIPNQEGFYQTTRRYVSFFTNWSYTWKQKYIATFSARRDASNLFGVNTNERWNPLWSAGTAWSLDKESFLASQHWINSLRLRATYGHSGNSGGVSSSLPTISHSSAPVTSLTTFPRATINGLPNPSLKWEDVRMINLALTFVFFNQKLSGSIEHFNKKSTDLLSVEEIDPTVGLASARRNVGVMKGQGWDLRLSSRHTTGDFNFSTTLFMSLVKDVIKEFKGSISNASTYVTQAGRSLRPLPNKQLYPVFALPFAGLDGATGDPQGYYKGEVSKEYQKMYTDSLQNIRYFGTGLPPRYGSLRQVIAWKNLSLSFLISFKYGHYFQRQTIHYTNLFNTWAGHSDYSQRWQQPGDELQTTIPSLVYPANNSRDQFYTNSEANIGKGDLIRLQDININYTFNPSVGGKRVPISITGAVNNVALLWTADKKVLDPDYTIGNPPSRRYSIGVNCKF